ncbi:MAG: hypothetical protein AABZ61_07420 [Bacteroidota bacterium]|jgi:hypothetical protein
MTFAIILVGLCLLVLGRKLFWLFVGVIGFLAALSLSGQTLHGQPQPAVIITAIGIGLVGALLALFLQKVAIALAGFAAGGYITFILRDTLGWGSLQYPWLPILIGAILGAVLLSMLFEWALIILSSLIGSYLITQDLGFGSRVTLTLFIVIAISGIVIQAGAMRKKRHKRKD